MDTIGCYVNYLDTKTILKNNISLLQEIPFLWSLPWIMKSWNIYSKHMLNQHSVYTKPKRIVISNCAFMGYAPVPASTTVLCRYAAMLGRTLKYSTVKQYLCVIKKLHKEWNLPDPILDNYQLNSVLKGMRPALGDTPSRELPVDRDLLLQILSQLNMRSIQDHNIWAATVLMFFAMLHRANVLTTSQTFNRNKHLNRQDITFYPWGAKVHI